MAASWPRRLLAALWGTSCFTRRTTNYSSRIKYTNSSLLRSCRQPFSWGSVKSVIILMASFNFCDIINCTFSYITRQCLYSTIKYITMQVYGTHYISSPQLLFTAALEFSLDGSQQQHRVHHNFKRWNIH